MAEWILFAVTTVSVVFLWLYIGKIGERLEEQARELELLRGELRELQQSGV